jgi:hypothetical protein
MSEEENHKSVREHLSSTRLPCIPYLGMYLTDLTYLELATTDANTDTREAEVCLSMAERQRERERERE